MKNENETQTYKMKIESVYTQLPEQNLGKKFN